MSKQYTHQSHFNVYFADTDAAGVVHHSRYITWYEAGRMDYLEAVGHPYHEMQANKVGFSPIDISIQYLRPVRLGDKVSIHTTFTSINKASIVVEGQLFIDGLIGNTSVIKLACLDEANWKPTRIPQNLLSDILSK